MTPASTLIQVTLSDGTELCMESEGDTPLITHIQPSESLLERFNDLPQQFTGVIAQHTRPIVERKSPMHPFTIRKQDVIDRSMLPALSLCNEAEDGQTPEFVDDERVTLMLRLPKDGPLVQLFSGTIDGVSRS